MKLLNSGIIIVSILIVVFGLALAVVLIALWNVTLAKEWFYFLEISNEFPTKVIAFCTGLAALSTFFLALVTIVTIKNSNKREELHRKERILDEIIKWSIDAVECVIVWKEESGKVVPKATIKEIFPKYLFFNARALYIKEIAKEFKDSSLQSLVHKADTSLRVYRHIMRKYLNEQKNDQWLLKILQYVVRKHLVYRDVLNVTEYAAELKRHGNY